MTRKILLVSSFCLFLGLGFVFSGANLAIAQTAGGSGTQDLAALSLQLSSLQNLVSQLSSLVNSQTANAQTTFATPDILNNASFETTSWDGFTAWGSGTPDCTRATDQSYSGSYSAELVFPAGSSNDCHLTYQFSGQDHVWVRFYFRLTNIPTSQWKWGRMSDTNLSNYGGLFLDQNTITWGWDDENMGVVNSIGLTKSQVADGKWHSLEFDYWRNGDPSGYPSAGFWFDGQPQYNELNGHSTIYGWGQGNNAYWSNGRLIAGARSSSAKIGYINLMSTFNSGNSAGGQSNMDCVAISSSGRIGAGGCMPNSGTSSSTDMNAPSVPLGVTATPISSSQINLSWTASTDNVGVTGYNIYRNGVLVGTSPSNSYSNTGLSPSTAYSYTVAAYDAAGNVSGQSSSASATTQSGTPASTKFTIGNVVQVTSGPLNVRLAPNTSSTVVGPEATGATGTVIGGPTAANSYNWWQINWTNSLNGWSAEDYLQKYTAPTSTPLTADVTPPSVPTGLTATTISSSQINLSWTASTDNVGVSGYRIYRSGTQIATSTTNSYSNTGLSPSTAYSYTVAAYDAAGNVSGQSIAAVATTNATTTGGGSSYRTVINDGFESGNLNSWFNDGGGAIMSNDAHSGSYSVNYDPNRGSAGSDHFGKVNISPTFREAYLRMWVKFEGDIPAANGGQAGAHFWRFISWPNQGGGFGPQLDMNMSSQTYWMLYYFGGDVEKSYPILFKKNVWQEHVIRINLDTNKYQYQVDGQNMVNEQGTNYNLGWTGGFDSWIFTNYDQGTGGDWKVDDVLLVTGPGASNYTETGGVPVSTSTLDITAPSVPASLTATTISSSQINLSWTASTDNVGVSGYRIYRSGTQIATSTTNSYSNTGLSPSTAYSYTVAAYDAAGNVSGQSSSASATTQGGTPASTKFTIGNIVQVTSGPLNVRLAPNTSSTVVGPEATGATGTVIGGPTAANSYNWWQINWTNSLNGWSAEDYLQKYTAPTSTPLTADVTPPSVPTGLTATTISSSQINLSWTASTDNVGTSGYKVFRNGVQVATPAINSYSDIGLTASTVYTYTVSSYDGAGNNSSQSAAAGATTSAASTPSSTSSTSSVVFFQENFDDSNLSARGWYDLGSAASAISTTEHIPGSTGSVQIHFTNGATAVSIGRHDIPASDSVYVSYWIKHSTNWVGSMHAYHPHWMHVMTNEDGLIGPAFTHLTTYIEENYHQGVGSYAMMSTTDGLNIDQTKINQDLTNITEQRASSGCNGNADGYTTAPYSDCYLNGSLYANEKIFTSAQAVFTDAAGTANKNNWHFVEAYFKLNSIQNGKGMNDGIEQYWVDGQLVIDKENVLLRTGAHPTMKFNQFLFLPYIGDGSPADQSAWVDNLTVANVRPGSTITPPPSSTDTNAPSVPASLTATTISSSQINLSWTASTDNVGVSGYRIYRSGTQIATSTTNSYSNTGLSPSTAYSYTVAAYDAAGNVSGQSSSVSATTKAQASVDNTPPSIPAGLTASVISSSQINLSWTAATDNIGVAGYRIFRNSTQVATTTGTGTTYQNTGLAVSTIYTYSISAYDAAGNNSAQSASVGVTTGATSDSVPPVAPTNLSATSISSSQINLFWTASTDNLGVTGYRVYRNNVQVGTTNTNTYSDVGLLPNTAYMYSVVAYDAAGNNSGKSSSINVTTLGVQDITPPTIPTGLMVTAFTQNTVSLSWNVSTDNIGVAGYQIYRNATQIASTTANNYTDLGLIASTTYAYAVAAYDVMGNSSGRSSLVNVTTKTATVDTTSPSVPTGLVANPISSSQINLAWTASNDDVGVMGYRIYRNGNQIATVTSGTGYSDSGLAASAVYSYAIAAYDVAGNLSNQSAIAGATTLNAGTAASTKFSIGNQVQATNDSLRVRSAAGIDGTLVGREAFNAVGTVAGGPTTVSDYNWWKVNWTDGLSGWSAEDYLQEYSAPPVTSGGNSNYPPTISNGSPWGILPAGTTSVNLSVTTNEPATCRYALSPHTDYSAMANTFTTTGGTNHQSALTGFSSGVVYTYYVRCADRGGNVDTRDYFVAFFVFPSTNVSTSGDNEKHRYPISTSTNFGPASGHSSFNFKPFLRQLSSGANGDDVSQLQLFLKQDPSIYPEGIVSGYYGYLTMRAVQRFQCKYNIACSGGSSYGSIDASTLNRLNLMIDTSNQPPNQ